MSAKAKHIKQFALGHLTKGLLKGSGSFIYSSSATLRKGPVYFCGLNPGGEPSEESKTLEDEIKEFPRRKHNAFLDGCWAEGRIGCGNNPDDCRRADGKPCLKGNKPLQSRVQRLFKTVGLNVEDVCASNLIFQRTRDVWKLPNIEKTFGDFWPVHEEILKIVKPSLFLIHGVRLADLVQKKLEGEEICPPFRSGSREQERGDAHCRMFRGRSNGRPLDVILIPHLSWSYDPVPDSSKHSGDRLKCRKRLIKKIKESLRGGKTQIAGRARKKSA